MQRNKLKKYKRKLMASGPVGRPKIRWVDNVMRDIEAMKIVNWKKYSQDK
jgi:hypothetical protein